MLATAHPDLKSQILNACLAIFPEAQCILLWGGSVTPDFSPAVSDIDVIIEIAADFGQEVALSERLKSLMIATKGLRLDPFVYLSTTEEVALEFIAPFGFYKANPFIPYLIKTQHEVLFGQSRLLDRLELSKRTLNETLLAMLPTIMGALKRLRMDAQVEESWDVLERKHRAALFMVVRSYFAFQQDGVGSKRESLSFLAKKHPEFRAIGEHLGIGLEPGSIPNDGGEVPGTEMVLSFVKDMEAYFQAVKRRQSI